MRLFSVFIVLVFFTLHLRAGDEVRLMSLYPVPLKNSTLNVRINIPGSGLAHLELRNLIGKKLQEQEVPAGTEEVVFGSMDTYPNGVYVVVAKNASDKVLEISKFIMNK
ncbi:MAG TPA: T9SS type A sorting domain-containing protein [Chitinophagaceae bacterium]|nr:T9SS type A sorting domain-containing protein [Chitinophagaceae bacterium]HNF71727.1 T9SS type A sorting domain-containing protein [Chitinophagaceae bacterium]